MPEDVAEELRASFTSEDLEGIGVQLHCHSSRYRIGVDALLSGWRHHVWLDTGKTGIVQCTVAAKPGPYIKLPASVAAPNIVLPHEPDKGVLDRKASLKGSELVREAGIPWQPVSKSSVWVNRSDILALLHKKLGLQIISDHYSRWSQWDAVKEHPASEILDTCKDLRLYHRLHTGACWGWDGKFLYMRTQDIQQADEAEIPNRLFKRWRAVYAKQGWLGLNELAEMALPSEEQTRTLDANFKFLGLADGDPERAYCGAWRQDALRMYGLLTPRQRREALSLGTSVAGFTPGQRLALGGCLIDGYRTPYRRDGCIVGMYNRGLRVDKPEPPGPNTPMSYAICEAGSETAVFCKIPNSSIETFEYRWVKEGPTLEEALQFVRKFYPDIKDDELATQRTVNYKAVITFANGATHEIQVKVPMGIVDLKPKAPADSREGRGTKRPESGN